MDRIQNLDISFLRTNTNGFMIFDWTRIYLDQAQTEDQGSMRSELKNFDICENINILKISANRKDTNITTKKTDRDKTYVSAYRKVCTQASSKIDQDSRESTGLTCSSSTFIKDRFIWDLRQKEKRNLAFLLIAKLPIISEEELISLEKPENWYCMMQSPSL